MPPSITIEPISESNFDEFLRLIDRLAEYEKLDPPDEGARARLWEHGLGEHPLYEAFIARLDGEVVAYAIYFMTYSSFKAMPTLYLEDIFVLEEHRRKGVGRRMFARVVARAKEKGCGRMEWCVLDWNTPAQRFYKATGAERLGWYFYRLDGGKFEGAPPSE